MKTVFTFLAAAVLAISTAQAALIFQTQNYSNVSGSASGSGLSLLWDKFDTGLGTLTGVTMEFSGSLTGSFSITNEEPISIDVYDSRARFRMNFSSGSSAPANITGSFVTPLNTTPGTGAEPGTSIPSGQTQVFNINGPISLYNSGLVNYFANADYFSSAGPATFSTTLFRNVSLTTDGEDLQQNFASSVIGGTINLTYEYTPAAAIPEPGTWAAAALLIGGAAFARWRKRKSA
jgi:hypothetical protein